MTPPGGYIQWTPEEDKLLTEAIATCDSGTMISWKSVSKSVPGRSNKACRKRWLHSLDPKLRKGRWTTSEDAALLEAVKKHGERWFEVAKDLPGRTDNQCANRYKESVDPSMRRDPWTEEEDKRLLEAFQRLGNKWRAVSRAVGGRSAERCRNRLESLRRLCVVEQVASDNVEPKIRSQKSTSSADSLLPNFPTPLKTPPSPTLIKEPRQSLSGSSLSCWASLTPLLEPSPSTCMTVAETLSSTPHPTVSIEEIGYPPSMDRADYASQDPPLHDTNCTSGLVRDDQGILDFVADPIQTGFWGRLPSQIWASALQTQPVQNTTPSSIQGDPDLRSLPVIDYGDSLIPLLPMTCPIPHCCFQCQAVLDMWKHITWTHIQPNSRDSGVEHIVKCILLGGLS